MSRWYVKNRVKDIMQLKKPAAVLAGTVAAVCVLVIALLMYAPGEEKNDNYALESRETESLVDRSQENGSESNELKSEENGEGLTYQEILDGLQTGQGYAYVSFSQLDNEVLLVTDSVYEDNGMQVSLSCDVYYALEKDGPAKCLGTIMNNSPLYPISYDEDGFWTADHHAIALEAKDAERRIIALSDVWSEEYDEGGKVAYWYTDLEREQAEPIENEAYYQAVWHRYELADIVEFIVK